MGACIDNSAVANLEHHLGVCNDVRFGASVLSYLSYLRQFKNGTICDVFEATAASFPDKLAVITDTEAVTFRQLDVLSNRLAHWVAEAIGREQARRRSSAPSAKARAAADASPVATRPCVALFMQNSVQFIAAWLACAKAGATIAFVNTYLSPPQLLHALRIVGPVLTLSDDVPAHLDVLEHALVAPLAAPHAGDGAVNANVFVWRLGVPAAALARGDAVAAATPALRHGWMDVCESLPRCSPLPVSASLRAGLSMTSVWGYVYTSGTTGMPKGATITHMRFLMAGYLLGQIAGITASDIVYCALPLYHAAGGMIGLGNALTRGCTFVLARKFSVKRFWIDVVAHRVTVIQYIGELCRFLVAAPSVSWERQHCVRMALGNGLRPDVWDTFQTRFKIPTVVEFYASTEGNATLINVCTTPRDRGAVGRYGVVARALGLFRLAKYDDESEDLVRDASGRCVPCGPDEVGELLSKLQPTDTTGLATFSGYHGDTRATQKKIARDVFVKGDAYFRTGDLLRMSSSGHFYFVDRIGDTFRWRGENVATTEVAEAVTRASDAFQECMVYGVAIPGNDGRCGMAAVVLRPELKPDDVDWVSVAKALQTSLARYAVPYFVRILPESPVTSTFKHVKRELRDEGADPTLVKDPLLILRSGRYERMTPDDWHDIVAGRAKM